MVMPRKRGDSASLRHFYSRKVAILQLLSYKIFITIPISNIFVFFAKSRYNDSFMKNIILYHGSTKVIEKPVLGCTPEVLCEG